MAFNTALIVDDSKLARVTLKKKLETHGLVVEVADSAEQAYNTLPSIQPDIIFMDHLMPGVDGFEATQHIRQMPGFQQIPIVMCTGKEQDGYLEEALAIGASFILSKPPVDEALNAILASSTPPELEVVEVETDSPVLDIPVASTAMETDVADFMSGQKESTIEVPVVDIPVVDISADNLDLAAMPETDIADFMAEGHAEAVADMPQPVQESLAIMPAGITADDVERICAQMIRDALAEMPVPQLPVVEEPVIEASVMESPQVDMEQILSTVTASVAHQLAVMTTALKAEMQAGLEALVAEKIAQTMDQDVQGILDLRLNVVLAEKFAETHAKIESLEKQLSNNVQELNKSADMLSVDAPLTLEQPGGLSSRMEQLYDEQISLANKVKTFQMAALGAALLAFVAIAVAFIR